MKKYLTKDFNKRTGFTKKKRRKITTQYVSCLSEYIKLLFPDQVVDNSGPTLDYNNLTFFLGCLLYYTHMQRCYNFENKD